MAKQEETKPAAPAWPIEFTLSRPVEAFGDTYTKLSLREPTAAELLKFGVFDDQLSGDQALDLIALLTFLVSPFDNLNLVHALRSPVFACSDDDLAALAHAVRREPDGRLVGDMFDGAGFVRGIGAEYFSSNNNPTFSHERFHEAHDLIIKALESRGIKVGLDLSSDPGQLDFSSVVLKVKSSSADALFAYTNEEESARLLRELKKQGYKKPVLGETVLTSQKVIELAGDAANGAIAHVGLTADAPQAGVKKFDAAYQKEFGSRSDHNGLKGYIGMYTVKAVTEKIGKFDSKAFAAAMKNISLSAKTHPGLLLDLSYDENGDLDRESYLTTVANGKQVVSAILPPVGKK